MSSLNKYFNNKMADWIYELTKDNTHSNFEKADILSDYLAPYGFREAGCGTNRIAYKKGGYIFKIALDSKGIRDNNNEYNLSNELLPHVAECYDNNGLISVAEKVVVMNKSDTFHYDKEIELILRKMSKAYVLNDVGPKSFLNWGINHLGNPVILDYGYIRPITANMKFVCRRNDCDGNLKYDDSYTAFMCDICGRKYPIVDIAGDGLYIDLYNDDSVDYINMDGIESELEIEQKSIEQESEKEVADDMVSIGEVLKTKVSEGNINIKEACDNNANINSAMKKTDRTISRNKESSKKIRKLADY